MRFEWVTLNTKRLVTTKEKDTFLFTTYTKDKTHTKKYEFVYKDSKVRAIQMTTLFTSSK